MSDAATHAPFYLVGPTAAGKTAVALELARRLDAVIVSADSIQV
ncbi:MAG: tRNA (adenosine(37)-N6)-dimethylallyltransferase MiaA, partial [Verrucomicrobia bacterium]|nr:tRNA (adenosine(37)-N6)-dimethylallyltransferase MiaA [Verrucomicrobiota bacterium]